MESMMGDYPTLDDLQRVEEWPHDDPIGWFEYLRTVWYAVDWGWSGPVPLDDDIMGQKFALHLSTAGWSGNESLIESMQRNDMLWFLTWYSSRRGGHYEFRIGDLTAHQIARLTAPELP